MYNIIWAYNAYNAIKMHLNGFTGMDSHFDKGVRVAISIHGC